MAHIWNFPQKSPKSYHKLLDKLNIGYTIGQILWNRGYSSEKKIIQFLSHDILLKTHQIKYIKDMDKALNRVSKGLRDNEKIVIYGDYDVDGITSSALLYIFFLAYSYIKEVNIDVIAIFPDRLTDGYGLKVGGIKKAIDLNAELIITVDNGISSYEAVEYANKSNVDVIIIDHHRVPDNIPPACAIVNPRQKDCFYPYKGLSAVGLVYKLIEGLCKELFTEEYGERFLKRYIDYVAIGTYQDIAPLVGENRFFVKRGMDLIEEIKSSNNTNLRGIIELLKVTGKFNDKINTNILGFCIGPMINAAGRIGDPSIAFKLLTTRDHNEAKLLAEELNKINIKRKELTKRARKEAADIIKRDDLEKEKVILLESNTWHQGIIGLIAQYISSSYKRSCIIMTNNDKDYYTGSARSYGNFNMGEFINSLREYFKYHGGHKKAAGFSIDEDKLYSFKKAFYKSLEGVVIEDIEINIDAVVNLEGLLGIDKDLIPLEPFGEANPIPVVAVLETNIKSIKKSKRGLDSLITVYQNEYSIDLVAFNETKYIDEFKVDQKVDIAIKVFPKNDYSDLKLEIMDIKNAIH